MWCPSVPLQRGSRRHLGERPGTARERGGCRKYARRKGCPCLCGASSTHRCGAPLLSAFPRPPSWTRLVQLGPDSGADAVKEVQRALVEAGDKLWDFEVPEDEGGIVPPGMEDGRCGRGPSLRWAWEWTMRANALRVADARTRPGQDPELHAARCHRARVGAIAERGTPTPLRRPAAVRRGPRGAGTAEPPSGVPVRLRPAQAPGAWGKPLGAALRVDPRRRMRGKSC
jgi:hypothetical protein